jgi:UDP-N-acetylglucosamine 1-carboxyvinyltransferase
MTRGDITIRNANPTHLSLVLTKLSSAGADITMLDDGFRVVGRGQPSAVEVVTLPYPGFPTDLQPMMIALNAVSQGAAMVTENIYESRFTLRQRIDATWCRYPHRWSPCVRARSATTFRCPS